MPWQHRERLQGFVRGCHSPAKAGQAAPNTRTWRTLWKTGAEALTSYLHPPQLSTILLRKCWQDRRELNEAVAGGLSFHLNLFCHNAVAKSDYSVLSCWADLADTLQCNQDCV